MFHACRSLQPVIGVACFMLLTTSNAYSDPLKEAINTDMTTRSAAIHSQKKVDALSEKTRRMLNNYRNTLRHTETLKTYNQYLRNLIASQQQEKISIKQQLEQIEITQREIVPLILGMLDNLEKFIQMDLPFLPEERQSRLNDLKQMINRADITNAEKYRRILEAYQIENDYGNTIEAYRANIELDGTSSSVDFLRLGRVALYFQRLDGSESGFWDKETKQWQILSSSYKHSIRNGLRIARKETAPDLLTVPIPVPEAAQ